MKPFDLRERRVTLMAFGRSAVSIDGVEVRNIIERCPQSRPGPAPISAAAGQFGVKTSRAREANRFVDPGIGDNAHAELGLGIRGFGHT